MRNFFDGLVNRIKDEPMNIAYDMIIFIGSVIILFGLIYIFLFLRRWYLHARIRRSSHDFEPAIKYIENTKRPLTPLQQGLLGQTGEVYDVTWKGILGWVFWVAACALFGYVMEDILEQYINIWGPIYKVALAIVIFGLIIYDIYALKQLISYGRILLFGGGVLVTVIFCFIFFSFSY